jgi:uncharacterized protein (DUF1778 family)
MATTKPRITITISNRQHQLLRSISDASGQSMSTFLVELLETSEPVLERLAATYQAIKSAKDQQRARFVKTLDDAQSSFEPLAIEAVNQLDMLLGNLESVAHAERSEATISRSDGLTPSPHTNRGVTPTGEKGPKPAPVNAFGAVFEKTKISKSAKKVRMQAS